jgi:hypothetical protein
MKFIWLVICVSFPIAALCGCTIGEWEQGAGYEQKFGPAGQRVGESPYMPTIQNEEEMRQKKMKNWQEIHSGAEGLVGYLLAEEIGHYKPAQHRIIYYVYDTDSECVGFFTENGETFRYHFSDYKQEQEMIGHYEPEESCMHLLNRKNLCELKPLSAKPPQE